MTDAKRGPLALACLSFALMVSGAAYAALPAAVPAASASISLPARHATAAPAAADSAPSLPGSYGEPRPHPVPVVISSHEAHRHHLAVVAAKTPPPVVTVAATPSTAPSTPVDTQTPAAPAPAPSPAQAPSTPAPQAGGSGAGAGLLAKALTMAGVPYVYGGDTPSGFDCSGLVYWAALQLGVSSMPRDTYGMLARGVSSGLLVQVSTPSYGDLAFFGSGHVEFWVKDGETYGAQSPGTAVGYHSYGNGYEPTEFFKIT